MNVKEPYTHYKMYKATANAHLIHAEASTKKEDREHFYKIARHYEKLAQEHAND